MKKYQLPDGKPTVDPDYFSEEWAKVYRPFEEMGFKVVGFSPGLLLSEPESSRSFDLPLPAARRIIRNIKRP